MTLIQKLKSDLQISEAELKSLKDFLKLLKEQKQQEVSTTLDIANLLISGIESRILEINRQIHIFYTLEPVIDRRDGSYSC